MKKTIRHKELTNIVVNQSAISGLTKILKDIEFAESVGRTHPYANNGFVKGSLHDAIIALTGETDRQVQIVLGLDDDNISSENLEQM